MLARIVKLFLLTILTVTLVDCRKTIKKYPFDMSGVWFSSQLLGDDLVLLIENSGDGHIFTMNSFGSLDNINSKGKVKYRSDFLFVGGKKFKFVATPKVISGNDSIQAPDENDFTSSKRTNRKVLARMVIQETGIVSFGTQFTLSKYVDF